MVIRNLEEENHTIYIIQNVTTFTAGNEIIDVLAIEIKTNKRSFMVNVFQTQNNQNKTVKEINFLVENIKYFRLRAERVGAEENYGDNNVEHDSEDEDQFI
ncbi:unnamed protein product [Rotaria sordida]|uniref:Uncharacterized protein n=1 Tax=Rotaria sordida TaxID=392033 RepID=A0A819WDY8_9BILA|nr:unnamed protein product [Rotaria sordida]